MHIQSSQQSPSFVTEPSQAMAGRLGQAEARQVAIPREAQQLVQRQEAPKGEGLLSRLGAAFACPFVAIIEWLGKLLGSRVHITTQAPLSRQDAPPVASLSAAEIKQMMLQKALPLTSGGLGKVSELVILTAGRLAKDHTRLASGDGAPRSLVTALVGIRDGSLIEASRTQVARLLGQSIGGIAL